MSSHEDIPLRAVKYGVAVSWDLGRQAVDLDLQDASLMLCTTTT